jgi:hypothetical protein
MPEELGAHADAAREREDALAGRLRTTTHLDRAFVATVRGAAQVALLGRRRLDGIEAEIRDALANQQALALDTAAGARQFQRFLTVKTRDIHQVIADTVADSRARAEVVRSLSGGFSVEGRRGPGVHAIDRVTHKEGPGSADERRGFAFDQFDPAAGTDFGSRYAPPSGSTNDGEALP